MKVLVEFSLEEKTKVLYEKHFHDFQNVLRDILPLYEVCANPGPTFIPMTIQLEMVKNGQKSYPRKGAFEIYLEDGTIVFSKLKVGKWPSISGILTLLQGKAVRVVEGLQETVMTNSTKKQSAYGSLASQLITKLEHSTVDIDNYKRQKVKVEKTVVKLNRIKDAFGGSQKKRKRKKKSTKNDKENVPKSFSNKEDLEEAKTKSSTTHSTSLDKLHINYEPKNIENARDNDHNTNDTPDHVELFEEPSLTVMNEGKHENYNESIGNNSERSTPKMTYEENKESEDDVEIEKDMIVSHVIEKDHVDRKNKIVSDTEEDVLLGRQQALEEFREDYTESIESESPQERAMSIKSESPHESAMSIKSESPRESTMSIKSESPRESTMSIKSESPRENTMSITTSVNTSEPMQTLKRTESEGSGNDLSEQIDTNAIVSDVEEESKESIAEKESKESLVEEKFDSDIPDYSSDEIEDILTDNEEEKEEKEVGIAETKEAIDSSDGSAAYDDYSSDEPVDENASSTGHYSEFEQDSFEMKSPNPKATSPKTSSPYGKSFEDSFEDDYSGLSSDEN
eukprot:g565.t1